MNKSSFFLSLFGGAALILSSVSANGQAVQVQRDKGVKISDVKVEAQNTPDFQASNVKAKRVSNVRQWLEIETEFSIESVNPRDAVVPELMFKYYVGFKDEQGQPVVLTGSVTYANMLPKEDYYSAVYVSPSTMGKITGDYRRVNPSDAIGIGVEVFYQGVVVGSHSSTRSPFWQQIPGQVPGVLSKEKTPFALLWLDRYPDVKLTQ